MHKRLFYTGIYVSWLVARNKKNQRWLLHAIDRNTNKILTYETGRRTKNSLRKLLDKLDAFNISEYYTDNWKGYKSLIPWSKHFI